MIKKLLWFLLSLVDDNWGYSTPLQKRFKVGDKACTQHKLKGDIGGFPNDTEVKIIELGRHDYLIEKSDGEKAVVYQFELRKI